MVKKLIFGTLLGVMLLWNLVGCGKETADFITTEDSTDSGLETESESVTDTEMLMPPEPRYIYVYVCGAVMISGVYQMPEGSRVCDVFQRAGGLTKEAAGDYWNQARILQDGEMIYVPTEEEAAERSPEEWAGAASSGNTHQTESGGNKKVNINTASKEELMTLPGIGESKALAILAYRKEKGRFSSVNDLKDIPGIKEAVFSKIEEYITVN